MQNLRYRGTPNDNIALSPSERQASHKNLNKLYIFWKLNNSRLRKRIYIKKTDNSVENIANVFQKYIVHKIGSAPLKNGLESKANIAPNSSHLCLQNRVSEFFYLAWFVFCPQFNFEV